MLQKMQVPVSVKSVYDHKKHIFSPVSVSWEGRGHAISKIGYHHCFHSGKTLFHVFSVISGQQFFKLVFNTTDLLWELEELSDGQAD